MFELILWNGEYGNDSAFIVRNEADGKFCLFRPAHRDDVAWTDEDLTKKSEYRSGQWQRFSNPPEKIEDLRSFVF